MSGILLGSSVGNVLSGTEVDLLVNYTVPANGTAVSPANIAAAEVGGVSGSWGYISGRPDPLAATTVRVESVTRFWPLLCDGISYQTVDRFIRFNLAGNDDDWEGLDRALPAGNAEVTGSLLVRLATTGSRGLDFASLHGSGTYAVCQANGSSYIQSHSQTPTTTRGRGITDPGGWLLVNWRYNATDGKCELVVMDNDTGVVILASECSMQPGGTCTIWQLSNYLTFNGGTMDIAIPAMNLNGVFPLDPITLPAPSSVSPTQTDVGEVTLTWASVAQRFKVERSSDAGANWSTLNSDYNTITNTNDGTFSLTYVDDSVLNAVTYIYRLSALCAGMTSATTTSGGVTVDNTPAALVGASVEQTDVGEVTISWIDTNSGHFVYRVDQWEGGVWTNNVAETSAGAEEAVITGLTDGVTYNFRVYGYNSTDSLTGPKSETGTIVIDDGGFTPFTYYSAEFDGTNDYLLRGGDLTGNADTKEGLVSFWIKMGATSGNSNTYYLQNSTGFQFFISRGVSGQIRIRGLSTGGGIVFEIESPNNSVIIATGWVHVMVSWNLATSAAHLYLNGVSSISGTPTISNTAIDYTAAEHSIGSYIDGTSKFRGLLCEYYFTNTYLDLSVTGNRDKFFNSATNKPVDLGANGSTPTGAQPLIYLRNAVPNWETNLGSGGGFTENGTLVDGGADKP